MAEARASLDGVAAPVGLLAAIALGLAAGAMLAEAAVFIPSWRSMPPAAFLAWYHENAARLFDFFGPLEIGSAVLASAAAVLYRVRGSVAARPFVVAAVLAVAVLVMFPMYFEGANASFAEGTIGTDNVAAELARYASLHWLRTTIGTAAFVAAVLGARDGRKDANVRLRAHA